MMVDIWASTPQTCPLFLIKPAWAAANLFYYCFEGTKSGLGLSEDFATKNYL